MNLSRDNNAQRERIEKQRAAYPATSPQRRAIRAFVVNACRRFCFDGPVLDVGCGYRSSEPEICQDKLLEYYTLDQNPAATPDYLMNAENMAKIEGNKFGLAACVELLEHVRRPTSVLAEIHRVLRPGGGLILTVPFWREIHEKPPYQDDYWRFTPKGVRLLLTDFDVLELETFGDALAPVNTFVVARKPTE